MISESMLGEVISACTQQVDLLALRARYPGVHFTECSEDDINARFTPVQETESIAFFLVSGRSGHCLEITSDFSIASGIVIAHKADE